MKQSFFARRAVLILMVVFFVAPFALRGARLAVQGMRNDVKDWLPNSFEETKELAWFGKHFLGEQFIVASWDGCTGDESDARFRVFLDKFFRELPPSERSKDWPIDRSNGSDVADGEPSAPRQTDESHFSESLGLYVRQLPPHSYGTDPEFIGNRLGLYSVDSYHEDWGLKKEKWLKGDDNQWYYILPNGDLYKWQGNTSAVMVSLLRGLRRLVSGKQEVAGELVASLGPVDGPWYYRDPRRLEAALFKSVVTGPAVLHDLTRRDGSLEGDVSEAKRRLEGVLFGPDGKQTCFFITLTEAGRKDLRRVVGRGLLGKPRGKLLDLADQSGVYIPPKPSLLPPPLNRLQTDVAAASSPVVRFGGPAVDNVAIDEEGQITLVRLVGLSVLLGVGLSWLCFRSFVVTFMVLVVGGLSAITGLAIVRWSGSSVDAVLMSMPSLVYVLGLSGAVHIVNYYRESAESNGLSGAPGQALKLGWQPCTLAALTTGLGLMSLTTSNILPIRKFGLFSAIGVVATLALLFTYLPAALELWPPGYHRRGLKAGKPSESVMNRLVTGFWRSVGTFVIRRHALVTVSMLAFMGLVAIGLGKINTSIQLLNLFDSEAKIIRDYRWLETHLGNLVPMELVVRVDPTMMRTDRAPENEGNNSVTSDEAKYQLNFLERMEITNYVKGVIDDQFGSQGTGDVGQAMAASTFAPELPGLVNSSAVAYTRSAASRTLESHRKEFLASDYLREENGTGAELWRISLRLKALGDIDYGQFVNKLKCVVEPVMAAYEYRNQILRAIDRQRDGGERGFRGARVCLVGAPLGSTKASGPPIKGREKATDPEENGDTAGGSLASSSDAGVQRIDQSRIFSRALWYLLKNAGARPQWHDPAYHLPKDWARTLSGSDCVVLVDHDSLYDDEFIREHAPFVFDASDHGFDPASGAATAAQRKQHVSTVYTGIVPVVYKAQRTLLRSLIQSTGWAFVMIAIVMIILVRSPRGGLVSMLPNVFPVVVIFGAMGWRDVVVDIGTMMTASVAMGVAVDDTIHFLTWFRRGLDEGKDRKGAIMKAYDRCATAMTQTTLIGGLGMSIFGLSTFTPTQRFGVLMLLLMLTALVGDLIFLPAILAGPLGGVFQRRRTKNKSTQPTTSPPVADSTCRIEKAHDALKSQDGKPAARRGKSEHPSGTRSLPLPKPGQAP